MPTLATQPFTLSFLLAPCASLLCAQAPTYDVSRSYALGTDGATLGRSVSGDVTGDLLPDLVVRSGTGARMLVNPGCLDKVVTVPAMGPIHDIAILSAVPALGSARLVIASELELELLSYSPSAPAGTRWSSVVVPDPLAANAARLRSADVDGSGTDDLIVVLADQRTLRYELHLGNGVFTPAVGFTMPQDVVDVAAVELDGDPGDELAILATNGLHLRQPDGTEITPRVRNAFPGEDAMCVLRHPGFGNRVLYTTLNTDGTHLLLQIGAGGIEASWNLGVVHPVSIQVADYDHDGDADLLMTESNSGTLRILLNDHMVTGVPTFSTAPGQMVEVTATTVTEPNAANARWFNANLDGELDLFLGITATSEVRGLIGNALPPPGHQGGLPDTVQHPVFRHATYRFEALDLVLDLEPDPGPYDQMEVTVWIHQPNGHTQFLNQVLHDLVTEPGTTEMPVTVAVPGATDTHTRYYMTVRKVTMNGPTTIASGAVYAAGFCSGRTAPAEQQDPEIVLLRNDSDPGYAAIPYQNMRTGDQSLGLFVPMPRVPHFLPGID